MPSQAVRTPPAASRARSVVVQDRADPARVGEQRVTTVAEQVEVEVLVSLRLVVAFDLDRDGLGGLAGGEGQRAGPGDVVVVTRLRRAVRGAERHRYCLVVGGRERDREGEQRRLILLAFLLGHGADADARLVVHDGAHPLAVGDGRVGRAAQVDENDSFASPRRSPMTWTVTVLLVSPGAKVSVPEAAW